MTVPTDAGNFSALRSFEFSEGSPFVAWSTLLILGLGTVAGIFGNGLILAVVGSTKGLNVAESVFVANLAISDMYVSLIANPISFLAKLEGEAFFDRIPHFCRVVGCLCTIACVNSLGTIACMSFNRCIHICYHEYYHRFFTKKSCVVMCIGLYAIGTSLVLLNAAGVGDHEFDRKSLMCIWDRMASYPYTVVFSVTLVWIPIVVVAISYLTIFVTVAKSQKRVQSHNINLEQHQTNSAQKANFQRSVRLAKTLFIIYAVFSVCWIPYALIIVIDADDTMSHVTHLYITMWAHLHPSVNWLVYYLTNKKFSDAIDKLLGIKKCIQMCRNNNNTNVTTIYVEQVPSPRRSVHLLRAKPEEVSNFQSQS